MGSGLGLTPPPPWLCPIIITRPGRKPKSVTGSLRKPLSVPTPRARRTLAAQAADALAHPLAGVVGERGLKGNEKQYRVPERPP